MDNTLVYETGDCGSIPYAGAKLYPLRQVGKAADFDSAIRWFESIRGCHVFVGVWCNW